MKFIKFLFCLTAAMLPNVLFADDVVFEGHAPSVVTVGSNFNISYTVNAKGSDIRLPEIDGFSILIGPSTSTSSQTSITNGQITTSRSTTFTYVLKALKEGEFTIAPATVTSGGKQYQSNSLTITVQAAGTQSSSTNRNSSGSSNSSTQSGTVQATGTEDIIITQTLSKSSVYLGEGVELVTKIYTRADLSSISDIKAPSLTEFVAEDMSPDQLNFQREVLNGVVYQSAVAMRKVLIPQKSGKLTIEPITYEFVVKKRTRGSGSGFFDSFFDNVQLVRQSVSSKTVTLNVKPLPEGKPANFSGGVGSMSFNVTVTPQELEANNSVSVKVSVSGEGNLKLVSLPKPQFHSDFDTFDPQEKSNITVTTSGYKGSRTAEYLVIPRRDGEFEIPELKFSYFDLAQGKYVTARKGPFTLKVSKGQGDASTGTVTFSGGGREQVQYIGSDLRYLHVRADDLEPRGEFFLGSPAFYTSLAVPLVVLVIFFFVYRKRISDNANIDRVKMRKANKTARRRLKQAAKLIKENRREAFFDEVMRALWGYLSDKLTLPLSELTKDNAKEEMQRHDIDAAVADEFLELLDTCEFARYAPAEVSKTMDEVYAQAANVIGKIDGNIKK